MKKIQLLTFILLISLYGKGQVKISDAGNLGQPHASAILELESSNKGLLIPRVTDTNSVVKPTPAGLVVFSNSNSKMYFRKTDKWIDLSGQDFTGQIDYTELTNSISNAFPVFSLVRLFFPPNPSGSSAQNLMIGSGTMADNSETTSNNGVNNIGLGQYALRNNVTGVSNIAIGNAALQNNTGNENTGIGRFALDFNSSGNKNVAIGFASLRRNTSGTNNVAIGNEAMQTDGFTGSYNTALGFQAGSILTTGSNNIAIGSNTAFLSATGDNQLNIGNEIFGRYVGDSNNTVQIAIGTTTFQPSAMLTVAGSVAASSVSASSVSASSVAASSVEASSVAASNLTLSDHLNVNGIYIGRGSGGVGQNTAVGEGALISNESGASNTAYGYSALTLNTTGNFNIAIGSQSLINNTTGIYNSGFGNNSLYFNREGSYNIALGYQAGYNINTGSNNIAIGNNTRVLLGTDNYQLNIGNEIYGRYVGDPDNPNPVQIAIGTTSYHASAILTIAGSISSNGSILISDRRFKKDIQGIQLGLKEVLQLKPSSYYWNTENERMKSADPTKLQYGFIAQELEQVIPAVVSGDGTEKDYKSVNYEALIPVLTKAIQEHQEMMEKQQEMNEKQMEKQQEMINALKKEIEILKRNRNIPN